MYSPPPIHLFFLLFVVVVCLFVFFLSKQYIMHVSGGFPVSFVRKFVRIKKKKKRKRKRKKKRLNFFKVISSGCGDWVSDE